MGAFSQLRLLLWRNLLQQWRSVWFTLFEFLIPFVLIGISFGLMLGFRSSFESKHSVTDYPDWPVTGSGFDTIIPTNASDPTSTMMDLSAFSGQAPDCQFLNFQKTGPTSAIIGISFAYTPKTEATTKIMAIVEDRFRNANLMTDPTFKKYLTDRNATLLTQLTSVQITCDTSQDYASDSDMSNAMKSSFESQCNNSLLAGIVFDDSIASKLDSSTNLAYIIRLSNTKRRKGKQPWDIGQQFAISYTTGPFDPDDSDGGDPGYWKEGFLTVQKAIDIAIHDYIKNSKTAQSTTDLLIGRFPFPAYQDKIIEIGALSVPGIVVFCFMTSVVYIVRSIVMEKENRLKEYMRVMGMSQWILWLSHFIVNYVKVVFIVIVLTIFMGIITPQSDWSVMLVIFLLYAFDAVYIAFLVSTFTQSGTTGTFFATIIWMILYLWQIIFITADQANSFSLGIQLLNCLNPDIAINYAITLTASYETQADGLHWVDFWKPASPDQSMTIGHVMLFLIGDGAILMLLTWYIEAVFPGGEGVPQVPWFFIKASYWFLNSAKNKTVKRQTENIYNPEYVKLEAEQSYKSVAIEVVGLSKTYGNGCSICFWRKPEKEKKKALDGLNLKMYEGEITALLGHNGAGKSTTFSLLTGVGAPTSGTAYIDDFDIRTSLPAIRKRLGLCPQYNILFSNMTVMEHLEFFCKLKEREWISNEALEIITRLRMGFKANSYAGSLSGGQKRKLSLAIALIGGSEIVMLDEPTSGMDPGARHETWTLLQAEKANRTILLTTHFMEEADILGDRIAILAHGQLQCCGSGMFLKSQYGVGYHLVVVYEEETKTGETLELIKKFVPEAKIVSVAGQEGAFVMPASYRAIFPTLFKDLETHQEELNITSFGVSITTMEEVFLKVGQDANERYNNEYGIKDDPDVTILKPKDPVLQKLKATRKLTGSALYSQHFKAMFVKREFYDSDTMGHIISTDSTFNGSSLMAILKNQIALMGVASQIQVKGVSNVSSFILDATKKYGTRTLGEHWPLAFDAFGQTIRSYFNNFAYNAAPIAVMMADAISLSQSLQKNITLSVTNHPLPPSSQDALKNKDNNNGSAYIIGYAMVTVMALIVSGNCVFLIRERKKKSKHMQLLSGLRPWMFWLTSFLFDLLWYLLRVAAFIAIFFIFNVKEYTDSVGTVLTLLLIQLLYGWVSIPQTYWLSFKFKSAATGYKVLVLFHVLTGIIGLIAAPIIKQTDNDSAANFFSLVYSFFFPTYSIANCFIQAYNNEFFKTSCSKLNCAALTLAAPDYCCASDKSKLIYSPNILGDGSKKGILWPILFMSVQGFFYWGLVYMRENDTPTLFDRVKKMMKKSNKNADKKETGVEENFALIEDNDVLAEKQVANGLAVNDAAVIVKDIKKWYGNLNAVKGVSFHVKTGECFGLLGVNGAGKTSTFQMLTGESRVSQGDAYILGSSVTTDWRNAGDKLGYCPQFDAIIKEMTGEETLYMFARIRGIHPDDIEEKVSAVVKAIGIGMYADKQIKTYSGGNKRRLSLGIALVGLPEVLLLDEPTTGVDPKARRTIWNILSNVRSLGTAIVLVSHSMEECEALCTELTIMVSGQFRCYGTCQHIKSRYGAGYTLLIRLKNPNDAERTKQEMYSRYKGAKLKEQHVIQLNFELPKADKTTWSGLFEEIEELSKRIDFDDYSLSQTTLEQVFLEFSRAANAPSDD